MTLDELNRLPSAAATAEFRKCCGSSAWAEAMTAGRPFASRDQLLAAADQALAGCAKAARREAFDHHPRIGEQQLPEKFGATAGWAGQEQAGVKTASSD